MTIQLKERKSDGKEKERRWEGKSGEMGWRKGREEVRWPLFAFALIKATWSSPHARTTQ